MWACIYFYNETVLACIDCKVKHTCALARSVKNVYIIGDI